MNRKAIFHLSESPYSYPTSQDTFFFRLRMAKEDQDLKVTVYYGNKFFLREMKQPAVMKPARTDEEFVYFETEVKLNDNRVGYVFEIEEDGHTYYYTEAGLLDSYDYHECYKDYFEYSSVHPEDIGDTPEWCKNAVFYQIFPDRFRMGNKNKDKSYITMGWYDKPTPRDFAGGDLRGIIDSLDYLQGLGINAIYLTPIFKAGSNHKYDTLDYFEIDPQFGTLDDFKELVQKAHEHGIRIVLDAVFNHMSYFAPEFQDVIKNGKNSRYWNWFYIHGDEVNVDKPNYWTFSIGRYMPKINVTNPETEAYLNSIVFHYLEYGIDGWRFDVGDEISHSFWRQLRAKVKAKYPNALILGEHWHNAHSFLRGDEFDGTMNYPVTYAIYDYLIYKKFSAEKEADTLNRLFTNYRIQATMACLNLLDSHDTHRFFNLAKQNKDILECAIALLFFVPGMSCLYYGTEIPMDGAFDPDCRRGFPYEEAIKGSPHQDLIKELIKIRKTPDLSSTDFLAYEENGLLVIKRGNAYLYMNATDQDIAYQGEPICSHNYENGVIKPNGFLIVK